MTTTLFDKTMGKILLWNEGARRLYGYEPEEVVGKANSSIGLALTRKIVVLQGGVIDVESEPGKGSTFTVELPIRHEQIAQEADHS
jgi:PAS domain S-box-containing protein